MPDIASLLLQLKAQNNALGETLTGKGVPASGQEGLAALSEKVKTINQHIAIGQKETVPVSASGTICAGDFVSLVPEMVETTTVSVEAGCSVIGSAFLGEKRVAAALIKGGHLYLKAAGQDASGAMVLGNSVLLDETAPTSATVVGFQGAAAVLYAIEGITYAAYVSYTGMTGALQYTEAIDADNACGLTACALSDGTLLACGLRDKVLVHYPAVSLTAAQGNYTAIMDGLFNLMANVSLHTSWSADDAEEAQDYVDWFYGTGAYVDDGAWAALTAADKARPCAVAGKTLMDSLDATDGTFTVPTYWSAQLTDTEPWRVFTTAASEFEAVIKNELREAGKTTETVQEPAAWTVQFGEASAVSSASALSLDGFAPEDEYAQGMSVAALSTSLAVLCCFSAHDAPLQQFLLSRSGNKWLALADAECVTATSMPCVSAVAIDSDVYGVASLVKRADSTEVPLLTFEGWYAHIQLGLQPIFWGAEAVSQGANISMVQADLMGDDHMLISCLADGQGYASVIELMETRPEGCPTVPVGTAVGYVRLHAINGSYALGVIQRAGGMYVTLYHRVTAAVKVTDCSGVDALASEAGAPGGTVSVYKA